MKEEKSALWDVPGHIGPGALMTTKLGKRGVLPPLVGLKDLNYRQV